MNRPLDTARLQPAEAFADYLKNTAARIDAGAEALALRDGARVGISRPHESAHLHVAGEAAGNGFRHCLSLWLKALGLAGGARCGALRKRLNEFIF